MKTSDLVIGTAYNGPNVIDYNTRVDVRSEDIAFPCVDARRREIGARVTIKRFDTRPSHPNYVGHLPVGVVFRANVQALRDGASFGASQPDHFFVTLAEAEAFVSRRVDFSRAAAALKARS